MEDENVIGVTGRSVYNWEPRYLHNSGLQTGSLLFNYGNSRDYIKDSKTVILVESPCNVLRLEESDIHNSVALFGTNLSAQKQFLLDSLGVTELILILDNDEAGHKASQKIIKDCSQWYNIRQIKLECNDVADMTPSEIRNMDELNS